MSGDLQVRKRKGKNKKKEIEGGSERPARRSKSQNGASSFIDSSPEYSDVPTFEHTEDHSDKSARNGSKKKRQQSPSKSSNSSGSGCCAKILFIFLVTFLVILAALIFIQLHPREYSTLVNEAQDFSINPVVDAVPEEDSSGKNAPTKKGLDIESIEKQIIKEEEAEAEQASFMKIFPRAIDVELPDYDPDGQKTPVQEPPIVKETAHVLGGEDADAGAVKTRGHSDEGKSAHKHSKAEDSGNEEEKEDTQLGSNYQEIIEETGEIEPKVLEKVEEPKPNDNLESPKDSTKPKRKSKKTRKAPPSPEEILAHQNTLDRGEMLMTAIRELSPNHPLLEELQPHLDGAKKDLRDLKLEGLESTTKHALIILEDLYVRLVDAKEKGELTTDHSRFLEEESQPQAPAVESQGSPPSDPAPPQSDSVRPASDSTADSTAPTTDSGAISPDSSTVSPDSVPSPSGSATSPPDSATSPPDSAPTPADSAPTSSDSAPTPADSAPTPADSAPTPADSAPTPADSAPTAPDSAPTPADSAPTPADSAATPADSAPTPADSAPTPADSAPTSPKSTKTHDPASHKSSSSGAAAPKESAPRELSASRGDVGLEDLTEADLASPVQHADQLLKLQEAEALRLQDPRAALKKFTAVVRVEPLSARAQLGRARCLDALALAERSNARLEQAIASYRSVLDIAEERPELVSKRLLRAATNTLIDKLRFRGHLPDCVRAQLRLLEIFPDDPGLRNQLGITYLLQGKPAAAQQVFAEVLERWPHDGLAQVHLGFILKTTDGNNEDGARLMKDGIKSGEPGTGDARFYFHLGDALHRSGRLQEAHQVYEEAAAKGLILRPTQRSLYNVNRLTAKPVWSLQETTYEDFFKKLQTNWEAIRSEGLALITAGFQPEAENLRDKGKWGQLELFSRGRRNPTNCERAPKTCSLVENFKPAAGCRRGQVKFSLMEGGTHVWAHCGPTNCRLRAHLGLVIPKEEPVPVLRVEDQYLKWKEGEILVFDDSFEHEVWHNGTEPRLVLIVDLWHPELTSDERLTLAAV